TQTRLAEPSLAERITHRATFRPQGQRRSGLAPTRSPGMKRVIGIVRPEKANEVLEALYRAEVRGFSMSPVQGHGGELDRVETYRGTTGRGGVADQERVL